MLRCLDLAPGTYPRVGPWVYAWSMTNEKDEAPGKRKRNAADGARVPNKRAGRDEDSDDWIDSEDEDEDEDLEENDDEEHDAADDPNAFDDPDATGGRNRPEDADYVDEH